MAKKSQPYPALGNDEAQRHLQSHLEKHFSDKVILKILPLPTRKINTKSGEKNSGMHVCMDARVCTCLSVRPDTTVPLFDQSEGRERGGGRGQRAQKILNFPFIRP